MFQRKSGNRRLVFSISLLALIALNSCKREEPTRWNIQTSGPLAFGRIDLSDLIADSLLSADENQLWHLRFTENLTDFNLDSLVAIPDTVIHNLFEIPLNGGPWNIPPGTTLITISEDKQFELSNVKLKEVIASGGFLQYSVRSYVDGFLSCTYTLPGLSLNGVGTQIAVETPPSDGIVPSVAEGLINLAGYHLDLTGSDGFGFNSLASALLVSTASDAPSDAIVFGQDSVVIDLRFIEPSVSYARGYFGNQHYSLDELASFNAGFDMPEGAIDIDEVSLRFRIENYTGIDASIDFSQLASYNQNSGSAVNLDQSELFETIHITRAQDFQGIVAPTVEEFLVNSSNSNINGFIENLPTGLQITGNIEVNPLGDVSGGNDFIYTDRALKALIEADIPLSFGLNDLLLKDTISIESGMNFKADGTFYLLIDNHFPFSAWIDAYLLDENRELIRMILNNGEIGAAIQGSDPANSLSVESALEMDFYASDIDSAREGAFIALRVTLNTPDYPSSVGLYTTQFMDFHLVTEAGVEISLE